MSKVCALLLALMFAAPVQAEQVVAAISQSSVEISSSFEGETLSLYGNIEDGGADPASYDTVIVVTGPMETQTVREKASFLGIWSNRGAVSFSDVPTFLQILSSRPLGQIADDELLLQLYLRPEAYLQPEVGDQAATARRYGRQLIRLLTEDGKFGLDEGAVQFRSNTLYESRFHIPSHATPGPYVAQTYVFQNGQVVGRKTDGFSVRKVGFERFLAHSSVESAVFYGLATVVLALISGWLAGAIFRRP